MSDAASEPCTIAVVGAGAIGGLLAAVLARAGHDVCMLARGAALAAIRDRGLVLHGPGGDHTVPIARVSDDPAALGAASAVLVAVKTWQLAELGPRLAPLVGGGGLVVPMQNGVEASEILAGALGSDRVLGATCRVIAWTEQPGQIRWIGATPLLTIGAFAPGQDDRVQALAARLGCDGLDVRVTRDIARARWLKFLFLAPFSAVGAVERLAMGALRRDPRARARLEGAMHEVAALAAARGVHLPPDAVAATLQQIDALPEDATASMHRDIVAGRPSELHELIGAVVRLGRDAGLAVPISAELYARLEPLERRARGG